ncbi:MAG: helix-turn-helix domain-containing protein [Mycobacterium sp.]
MKTLFSAEGKVSGSALPRAVSELGAVLEQELVKVRLHPGVAGSPADFVVGSYRHRRLDGLSIAHFTGSPMTSYRTPGDIRRGPRNDYLVAVHLRGTVRMAQDGRRATLEPGDIALLDTSRPYAIELSGSDRFEHVLIGVPRRRLNAAGVHSSAITAVRVDASSVAGRVLAPFFVTVVDPDWTESALTGRFLDSGLDLLGATLQQIAGSRSPLSPHAQTLLHVQRETRYQLGNPELTPADVAAACAISVRQLYRVFAHGGSTFGTWVREQRLAASYRDLTDPSLRHLKIGEVAKRWGYRSAAHHSRDFSDRYGVRPSDVRRDASRIDV